MSSRPAAALDQDQAVRFAQSADSSDRKRVAGNLLVPPELLYFLAADRDPEVRVLVASNVATPVQADLVLSDDTEEWVRVALARKLGLWAGGLDAEDAEPLRRLSYQALERLARDPLPAVRRILSGMLRAASGAPPAIVTLLAGDPDPSVAVPILQISPLLPDGVLVEILRGQPDPDIVAAIVGRARLSEAVSAALAEFGDPQIVEALLAHRQAELGDDTIDLLIDRAAGHPDWYRALVDLPRLSDRGALLLAQKVDGTLVDRLRQRRDLSIETVADLRQVMLDRLERDLTDDEYFSASDAEGDLMLHARQLAWAGRLDEDTLIAALKLRQTGLVRAGLAVMAELPIEVVERIFGANRPRAVVALTWRAGLPMSFALRLQTSLMRVPVLLVIKPQSNGDYPFPEDMMMAEIEGYFDLVAQEHKPETPEVAEP